MPTIKIPAASEYNSGWLVFENKLVPIRIEKIITRSGYKYKLKEAINKLFPEMEIETLSPLLKLAESLTSKIRDESSLGLQRSSGRSPELSGLVGYLTKPMTYRKPPLRRACKI